MSKLYTALLVLTLPLIVWPGPALARVSHGRWERIPITHGSPSEIFAKLGLTHMTRYGYTRDGLKKGTPDPDFPPGLTDVVPDDSEHVLLVCGTPAGLAEFRGRVAAAEVSLATTRWHVKAELLRDGKVEGAAAEEDLGADAPVAIGVGGPDDIHVYQLRLRLDSAQALSVICQSGLPLYPGNAPGSVYTPPMAWQTPVSKKVLPGGTVLFDDPGPATAPAPGSVSAHAPGSVSAPAPAGAVLRVTVTLNEPTPATPDPAAARGKEPAPRP